ncbi:MAG TPA: hypothetical protein VGF65_11430 [Mycobacterium sp.]|jgi:hypothetical protein
MTNRVPNNDVYLWAEMTPGALGRMALFADPVKCAKDLVSWDKYVRTDMADWFRTVAEELDVR